MWPVIVSAEEQILYSLLQTCRANGVNTYEYLKALFVALPKAATADDYEALLPWRINLPA